MADPLSVSASVAGLITIADIVIRNGYKYIRALRNADKAVAALVNEINLLSGTLHSLQNVVESLETESVPFAPATNIEHFNNCHETLQRINILFDKVGGSGSDSSFRGKFRKLQWPLKVPEVKDLISEVERHRMTLSLALQSDELWAQGLC